ncbi:SulP family inorganic anion transporter [Chryseolinea sp. H1M3-3]|uniref:SulP family inorganic anion transporter n=1 Tax=Chryseolinea sp. H1M3-3 TaxID=3034144 RepID=UPI0023ECC9F2|nr:SulP family inorganic anion transporter [Chryseolinea sp. H1M3-3]
MSADQFNPLKNFKHDLPSSIVVFLVALPLCLGVALASGAPLFSGIIAGVVGGIVVGSLSGSALSVSGPAAGLTTIVLASITKLGSFEAFLVAVFLGGLIQFILGFLKAGTIGNYFPSAVIKGMLSAIGIILILKQIPHALGYDKDFVGDESFVQADGENTFTELLNAINYVSLGAVIIFLLSMFILILWEKPFIRDKKFSTIIPGPLIVVALGVLVNLLFTSAFSDIALGKEHLVLLPVSDSVSSFISQFTFPDFSNVMNGTIWTVAFTIAIVASLESLLSIDAVDKLDPFKRSSPLNQELKAQGMANMVSGLIGGLPVTAVIVRSSANVAAGARTKASTIIHGILLLLTAFLIPNALNQIPLASLAAILIMVGYKLAKPSLFQSMYSKGKDQFIPFVVTILAILVTDLLIGITIGILVGLFFVLKSNFHKALFSVNEKNNYLIRLTKDVSFLNKALLRQTFKDIPAGSKVIIDGSRSVFIDQDILETINDFRESASNRDISVELKQSVAANNSIFKA